MFDLTFLIILLLVYFITVLNFTRRLQHFPQKAMRREIASVKCQFITFKIGALFQVLYIVFRIIYKNSRFRGEVFRTVVMLISFLAPVCVILIAQQRTFKEIKQIEEAIQSAKTDQNKSPRPNLKLQQESSSTDINHLQ